MLMTGYTKLFGSIVASTIWREDDKTRLVWITMLAIANKHGEVEASVPGLADLSRVSVEECRASLAKLEAPDPDSRSSEMDGRRIEKVEGGWRLINHAKYRAKLSVDERREYLTQKKREERARQQMSTKVNKCPDSSTPSTQAEEETEAKEEPKAKAKEVVESAPEPPAVNFLKSPSLETFCEYFSPQIPDLGFPVPIDNWLMEKHGYLASQVWPNRPPQNWKAMLGKLIADYRSYHNQQSTKTMPMKNGKPQRPINDF